MEYSGDWRAQPASGKMEEGELNELYHRARYVRRVGYDGPPPAPALAPEMCARIDTRLREAGRHSGCARPAVSARGVPNDERR